MDTPVLTKKQQKQSLSAKKGPVKGLRNVLAQPQDNYWPVVNQLDEQKLSSVLQKSLPALKRPSQKEKKKKVSSNEGTEAKEQQIQIEESLPDKDILNSIVLGINTVTRSLEKNQVCCILLDANVEPPLLIKHIIMMAQNKKKPVLLLPSLKALTFKNIGFQCTALALKNEVLSSDDHHFYTLHETVSCISNNYPSRQSLQLSTPNDLFDCTVSEKSEADDNMREDNTSNANTELISPTDIYKIRSSCKERIFIPPNETKNLNDIQKGADFIPLDDFISFNDNDMDVTDNNEEEQHTWKSRYFKPCIKQDTNSQNLLNKRRNNLNNSSTSRETSGNLKTGSKKRQNSNTNKVNYLPLKIKRMKGNINRVKATKVSKKKKKNQRK